jgi:hypothetical protein
MLHVIVSRRKEAIEVMRLKNMAGASSSEAECSGHHRI